MRPQAYPTLSQVRCPLCGASRAEAEFQIRASELANLYRQSLHLEVIDHFKESELVTLLACGDCHLSFYEPLAAGSDKFYQDLVSKAWYYNSEKPEFAFATSMIGPTDKVLDVGCGSGKFANYIDRQNYQGIELSDYAVGAARASGLKVHQRTAGSYAVEFPQSADVVCAFQVLEHVSDPYGFIEDCLTSLKSGGRLIISVPNADSFLRYAVNNVLNCPPHHVTWWNRDALVRVAEIFSLDVVEIHHDKLADEHLESYANTLIIGALSGRKSVPIDNSFRMKMFAKLASFMRPRLIRMLQSDGMRPAGHSITFVYRKN